jgi:hypothetical protein
MQPAWGATGPVYNAELALRVECKGAQVEHGEDHIKHQGYGQGQYRRTQEAGESEQGVRVRRSVSGTSSRSSIGCGYGQNARWFERCFYLAY